MVHRVKGRLEVEKEDDCLTSFQLFTPVLCFEPLEAVQEPRYMHQGFMSFSESKLGVPVQVPSFVPQLNKQNLLNNFLD